MKQLTGNTLFKFIAALLCVALLTGCTWCIFFGALFTTVPREEVVENIMGMSMRNATQYAFWYREELAELQKDPDLEWSSEYIREMLDPELTNFRYQIIVEGEEGIILSNFDPETQPYAAKYTDYEREYTLTEEEGELVRWYEYDRHNEEEGAPVRITEEEYLKLKEREYTDYWVVGYLALTEVPVTDVDEAVTDESSEPVTELAFAVNDKHSQLYDYLQSLAVTPARQQLQNGVICGALALLILIFLLMSAGHRTDSDEIVLRVVDRMPLDLWLFFVCCGVGLAVLGVYFCVEFGSYSVWQSVQSVELFELFLMCCIAVAALSYGFGVWMLMSFAARVKVKGWWRNCLCGRILAICWRLCIKFIKWCWKLCKNFVGAIFGGIRKIPLIWKAVVVFGAITVVEIVYCLAYVWSGGWSAMGCLWAMAKFVLCMGICLALKRLQAGARTIADGDLNHRVSTKYLYGDFKEHAECLNRIGDGLSRSVDSQLRSERMKTELITNVSHDLKTPLTSIVNYVDLLKKEHLEGTAAEYVEVLDRQSARLKKLTEDLVEASKASTGSLNVTVERVKLGELMEQAQAEYAQRLGANGLKTITRMPGEPVEVWADGKYVWRILDNLLSNVCKYAMPDTRVYLDVRKEGDMAVLSVKNISRECLNISADELMERFVRGDSSRNTEGSGLGLSIAQSLAKLMGGEVSIVVDGDLFKAEVTLPLAK